MNIFVIVYRLVAAGLVLYWAVALVKTLGKPSEEFRLPRSEQLPIAITRNMWLLACVLGIVAGLAMFAFSFLAYQ